MERGIFIITGRLRRELKARYLRPPLLSPTYKTRKDCRPKHQRRVPVQAL
jgi:hypothetical protein